jgi:hypothetical protein
MRKISLDQAIVALWPNTVYDSPCGHAPASQTKGNTYRWTCAPCRTEPTPFALGHALAIGCVVLAAALLGMALPREAIRYPVAALLFGLGIYSPVRHHHPRWVRMQVGCRDLTVYSLMASAHGAGLMLLPVPLGSRAVEAADHMAGHHHMSAAASPLAALLATAVHTAAYLAVTGIIAWVVDSKFGLAILRKAWLNLNLVWAAALVVTSVVTLLM